MADHILKVYRRWGVKSRTQLPLFMVWDEYWIGGEVVDAHCIVNSMDWPNRRLRSCLRRCWLKLSRQPHI